jgi:hypothetical protein
MSQQGAAMGLQQSARLLTCLPTHHSYPLQSPVTVQEKGFERSHSINALPRRSIAWVESAYGMISFFNSSPRAFSVLAAL